MIPEVERETEFIVGSDVDMLNMKFWVDPEYEAGAVVERPEVGSTADCVGKLGASELVENVLVDMGEVVKSRVGVSLALVKAAVETEAAVDIPEVGKSRGPKLPEDSLDLEDALCS